MNITPVAAGDQKIYWCRGSGGSDAPWWVEGNALVGGLGANGPQKLKLFFKNQVSKGTFSKPFYSFIDIYKSSFKPEKKNAEELSAS